MSTGVLIGLMAVMGLAVGSFLNVMIVRIPAGESLVSPPSKCPLCEAPIAKRDNIPVLSWILLKGRCRSCGEPIPAGYPLVEAANAALWAIAAVRFGPHPAVVPYALLFSILLVLSVIDLELYILPNKITYPSILVSFAAIPILSFVQSDDPGTRIVSALIGMAIFAGILLVTLLAWELVVHKEGMGMGDVKLAVLLGLWLGWIHAFLPIYALIASSVLGAVVGVGILVVRRESRPFPFGPWLALGTIVVILFARPILKANGLIDDDQDKGGAKLRRPASASLVVRAGR
jgi:leader peptidase (prepilin peptidase)/N-methyltransferase